MSFNFTFDKRTAPLMAGCVAVACLLIFLAGLLLGLRNGHSGSAALAGAGASLPTLPLSPGAIKESSPPAQTQVLPVATGESHAIQTDSAPAREPRAYCLQFGSFQRKANAAGLIKNLKKKHVAAEILVLRGRNRKEWYVVRSGKYSSIDAAAAQSMELKRKTEVPSLVRRAGTL